MKALSKKYSPWQYILSFILLFSLIGCNSEDNLLDAVKDEFNNPPPALSEQGELALEAPLVHGETKIGTSKEVTYTLKNVGKEQVRIDEYYLEGSGNDFSVTETTCGSGDVILQSLETCLFKVSFEPSGEGQSSHNLVVAYYPGETWEWTPFRVTLQGSGTLNEPAPTPAPTPVPVPTPNPNPSPVPAEGKLHTDGRFIKDQNGNVVVLKGVNIADPEHLDIKTWERPGVSAISVAKDAVENFHSKVVRIPIHPGSPSYPNEGWFGNTGGERYFQDHIKPLVDYLTSKKIYSIIDLHYVSDWSGLYPKVAAFWDFMAPKFKDNPYVIYEVFNEPIYPDNWNAWKDEIAQPAVNLIRKHAPENLIIVGGPLWSAHMAGAADNPIQGTNIVYTAHIYTNQWPNHVAKNFGRTLDELPVFVTEWGFETGGTEGGNRSSYGEPFAKWMDDNQFSWTVWCFDNKWGPRMFDNNWNLLGGDGGMGEFVKELLLDNHLGQ